MLVQHAPCLELKKRRQPQHMQNGEKVILKKSESFFLQRRCFISGKCSNANYYVRLWYICRLITLQLNAIRERKKNHFFKMLKKLKLLGWRKLMTNTDTFFSWVRVRSSVTGISSTIELCSTLLILKVCYNVRIFCTVMSTDMPIFVLDLEQFLVLNL